MRTFTQWLEDFAQTFGGIKNQWVTIDASTIEKDPSIADEIFQLINNSYKKIGGHFDYRSPQDVINQFRSGNISVIKAVDIDHIDDPDALTVYKQRAGGEKAIASASKSDTIAKTELIRKKIQDLQTQGKYGEVSGAVAKVLLGRVNVIEDEQKVRQVLQKPIRWYGVHPDLQNLPPKIQQVFGKYQGWYSRSFSGNKEEVKIMIGLPN